MKPRSLLTAFALLQALPLAAHALPSGFTVPECGPLAIENNTKATLIRDTQDCHKVWVLPPQAGTANFQGMDPSANLRLCGELRDTQDNARRLTARISETSKKIDEIGPRYRAAADKLAKSKAAVQELLQKAELKQLLDLNNQVDALETKISALNDKYTSCSENCESVQKEYQAASSQLKLVNGQIRDLQKQYLVSVRAYDRAKAAEASAQDSLDNVGAEIDQIMKKQNDFRNQLYGALKFFSTVQGGNTQITYDTGWDDAIQELSNQYRGTYEFQKIPTKEARIFANIVHGSEKESYLDSMPSLIDYSINGLSYLPYGKEDPQELAAFPSKMAGSLRLSLNGACPLFYPNFLDTKDLTIAPDLKANRAYAISATYKFPAAFNLNMTASYNLYKFYQKIVESSSSGGFFSSRTDTSVTEKKIDTDAFKIDWTVEDPNSIYDETKRAEVASLLKKELMGRVLTTMAEPLVPQPPALNVASQAAGVHGAIVLAKGLENTCGGVNVWCTAGVWVLRGLDSVFGGNTASSSYQSTWDRWATESWKTTATTWNAGAVVFTSDTN